MTICFKCGLPQFDGAAGYAGPQCKCFWSGGQNRLTSPAIAPCNCRGPQNGEPLCPCQMRGVVVKDGRYVRPEQDLGPVAPRDLTEGEHRALTRALMRSVKIIGSP